MMGVITLMMKLQQLLVVLEMEIFRRVELILFILQQQTHLNSLNHIVTVEMQLWYH